MGHRATVPPTIEQCGGRFLARGGATQLVEDGPEPKQVIIVEFTDLAAVKRWYNSPEHQKIFRIRLAHTVCRIFTVEGVS